MLRKLRSAVSRRISRHLTAWLLCACKHAPVRLMPAYPLVSFCARIFVLVSFDLAALLASDKEDNHQSICRRGATAYLGTQRFLNLFQIRFWLQRSTLRRKPRTAPNKPSSGVRSSFADPTRIAGRYRGRQFAASQRAVGNRKTEKNESERVGHSCSNFLATFNISQAQVVGELAVALRCAIAVAFGQGVGDSDDSGADR